MYYLVSITRLLSGSAHCVHLAATNLSKQCNGLSTPLSHYKGMFTWCKKDAEKYVYLPRSDMYFNLKKNWCKNCADGALPIENNGTLQVHFDAFLGA